MTLKSKEALELLIEQVQKADQTFLNPEKVTDPQGHVDGYKHIFHILRTAIDFYMLNDPLRPHFVLLADDKHKIYGDNVDAVYYFTQLRGDQEYEISGQRFDSCYLSFTTYAGEPTGEIADHISESINHTRIQFQEDGKFAIKLTPNPQGTNEFKLDADVVNLFTREYFFDRFNSRESTLQIKNLKPVAVPEPITDSDLAGRIATMSTFFEHTTWVAPLPVEFPLNAFLPPFEFDKDQGGWGTIDNIYCFGRFQLEENQYLKIRFTAPECCYWGVQTWNFLMQSMDYAHYPCAVNKGNSHRNEDGSTTIYLSHRDMDVPNLIRTAGYREAIIFCRWLLAEGMPETPEVELLEH